MERRGKFGQFSSLELFRRGLIVQGNFAEVTHVQETGPDGSGRTTFVTSRVVERKNGETNTVFVPVAREAAPAKAGQLADFYNRA